MNSDFQSYRGDSEGPRRECEANGRPEQEHSAEREPRVNEARMVPAFRARGRGRLSSGDVAAWTTVA